MAASGHRKEVVLGTTQLVQYEDDDDNDDKVNSHSDLMQSVGGEIGGDVGMHDTVTIDASHSNAHLGDQTGMEEAEGVAGPGRVNEGDRQYQDDGACDDVYMETTFREEMVVHQTHTGAEGSDLSSEAMRVFSSYETVAAHGHTEESQGVVGSGNDYSEGDLQERGLEEVALEERVHGDGHSPAYMPEEAGRVEEHSSFSSMQQLQLRAQILVYGDLIKGVLPEQALMSSAFSDEMPNEVTEQESERSPSGWNWEGPWQLAGEREAERLEAERLAEEERASNKGDVITTEGEVVGAENLEPGTPSSSPIRVAEDTTREGLPEAMPGGGTADHSMAGLDDQPADGNGVPSELPVNLDDVLDNIVATTVNSIDSSLLKDAGAESQVTRSPSLDPWLKPPSSQVPPAGSAVSWQTPIQGSNAGLGSQGATTNTPPVTATKVRGGVVPDIPSTVTGSVEILESGSRKRKSRARERKVTPAAPRGTASTTRRSRAKTASVGTTPASVPPGVVPSRLIYESSEAAVIVQGSSPASVGPGKNREAQGGSNLHADTQSWLEQAKASFEEAASAANSAAAQVKLVKSITTTPKSGKGAQLASASAAVNAAASVAKAAAEAAKVAYEAALQATMMVSDGIDTGLGKFGMGNGQGDKDGGLGGRRSAIAAAKEEARKRATATTPSMKITPQSTDAVLKAARLMAEAASQAGAVLAKGNFGTVPLSPVSQLDLKKSGGRNRSKKEKTTIKSPESVKTAETEPDLNIKGSMKKGARRRGRELQELAASNSSAKKDRDRQAKLSPDKATRRQVGRVMASAVTATEPPEIIHQSQIVDRSLVEVMNEEEGLRGGWFSAKVLELRTGEAYVVYDEILTEDGTGQLREWFPLEGALEGTERGRPRIRLISPNNLAREEGRRKRRRASTGQRVWSKGDRVDAFVSDGWWEGVVRVVDEDDDSKITVHFPGEGDTSVVKSWNLRPSFIWKNGRWEQWIRDDSGQTKLDDGHQAKKQKVSESPKVQARKSGRGKSDPVDKVSDEATESARASRRSKPGDAQSGNPVSPPISTRSSPRQKLPPKRKEGPTEVSTPTQVSTPISSRTRAIAQDAVKSVTDPLKRSAPSRTKSPLSSDVKKSEKQSKDLVTSRKPRNSEPNPSQKRETPATRQKATEVVKLATPRRSTRL